MNEKKVKIMVTHKNGETIVQTDNGVEWKFGGTMTTETVLAALIFQTVHLRFEQLQMFSSDFNMELTLSEVINKEEPEQDNELLNTPLTSCDLSVRTLNICHAADIKTLGDLTKIHKTDWLKFRNGGKKSLAEINDLLKANGLDWAPWR